MAVGGSTDSSWKNMKGGLSADLQQNKNTKKPGPSTPPSLSPVVRRRSSHTRAHTPTRRHKTETTTLYHDYLPCLHSHQPLAPPWPTPSHLCASPGPWAAVVYVSYGPGGVQRVWGKAQAPSIPLPRNRRRSASDPPRSPSDYHRLRPSRWPGPLQVPVGHPPTAAALRRLERAVLKETRKRAPDMVPLRTALSIAQQAAMSRCMTGMGGGGGRGQGDSIRGETCTV